VVSWENLRDRSWGNSVKIKLHGIEVGGTASKLNQNYDNNRTGEILLIPFYY
jgi:hypothetical protein